MERHSKFRIHNLKFQSKGFTLVEVLFVVAILAIIMIPLTRFQVDVFFHNTFMQNSLTAEAEARTALKNMIKELRSMSQSNTGTYPIELASSTAITFYTDTDGDGVKDRVRYFVSAKILKKGVLKPTGAPYQYVSANEKLSNVVYDVSTSTAIFSYYDKNYSGTSTPLAYPINVSAVRLIGSRIEIDKDPNKPPAPMIFESQVSIRNLKDNL